jgi:hypothetical protein
MKFDSLYKSNRLVSINSSIYYVLNPSFFGHVEVVGYVILLLSKVAVVHLINYIIFLCFKIYFILVIL